MVKAKIIVVGSPTLVVGLTLAGLSNSIIIENVDKFQSEFEKVLSNEEYGVVIVQENMIKAIDWRLKRKLDNLAYPIIVPVPEVNGESSGASDLRKLVKRALGFDIMTKD